MTYVRNLSEVQASRRVRGKDTDAAFTAASTPVVFLLNRGHDASTAVKCHETFAFKNQYLRPVYYSHVFTIFRMKHFDQRDPSQETSCYSPPVRRIVSCHMTRAVTPGSWAPGEENEMVY